VARKNGNGDGIRPRKRPDGRWEARYWAEPSTERKKLSVYGSSRKEVVDKLAEAMTKDDAPVVMPINIIVGEFLSRHLEVSKETLKKAYLREPRLYCACTSDTLTGASQAERTHTRAHTVPLHYKTG